MSRSILNRESPRCRFGFLPRLHPQPKGVTLSCACGYSLGYIRNSEWAGSIVEMQASQPARCPASVNFPCRLVISNTEAAQVTA